MSMARPDRGILTTRRQAMKGVLARLLAAMLVMIAAARSRAAGTRRSSWR
jgi:hypothetical protein